MVEVDVLGARRACGPVEGACRGSAALVEVALRLALVVAVLAALAVREVKIALVLPALVVHSREQRVAADGIPDSDVSSVTWTARNWHRVPVEQPRYAATAVKLPTHVGPMWRRS